MKNSLLKASAIGYLWLTSASVAFADVFGNVPDIGGTGTDDPEEKVIEIVEKILSFMALVAVIVIVIAGVRMVISQGEQEAIEKGKKTILWALVGLIIILLASAIVQVVAGFAGA